MYGHTLSTRKKCGGIVLFGGAIIEQNMKFPLTIIGYYDEKCYIFTNALVYHYETFHVPLRPWPESTQNVLRQCHLVVKIYNEMSNKC